MAIPIVVLEGDQTGQELLDEALRVLDPGLLGIDIALERYDLSLDNRRRTGNEVVLESAAAMRDAGLGIKAATITPEGAGDVGSPNRILREAVDGKVIVRTGRRLPGVSTIAGVHHPISIVRMAVDDAYGADERRAGEPGSADELAYRTERIARSTCRAVAEYAFAPPSAATPACTAVPSGPSPPSTRECSRKRWTAPPSATRTSHTSRS